MMKLFFSCINSNSHPVAPRPVRPESRQLTPAEMRQISQNIEMAFTNMGIPERNSSSSDESVKSAAQAASPIKSKRAVRS